MRPESVFLFFSKVRHRITQCAPALLTSILL